MPCSKSSDVVPDAMLVDIEMPRMDGFELTQSYRADENPPHSDHHDYLAHGGKTS